MLKNRNRGHHRQGWPSAAKSTIPRRVLVLQGGGALGAYQAGVYEALAAEGLEPGWVTGISIGAINAALIAGNPWERRVERLRAFWKLITSSIGDALLAPAEGAARALVSATNANLIAAFGTPGFFNPRLGGTFLARPGTPEALRIGWRRVACA